MFPDIVDGAIVVCGGGGPLSMNSCLQLSRAPDGSFTWIEFASTVDLRTKHSSWVSSQGLLLLGSFNNSVSEKAELISAQVNGSQILFDLTYKVR